MRLIFTTLALCMLAVGAAVGCNSEGTDVKPVVIVIPNNEFDVNEDGGEFVAEFTIDDDKMPEVVCPDAWIEGVQIADNRVSFSVQPNDTEERRTATITLKSGKGSATIEVAQCAASKNIDVFPYLSVADVPYRIPAVTVTPDGALVCVADYRHCASDIGVIKNGRIDLHYRLSYDNGKTWSDIKTLVEGKGAQSEDFMNVGFGDPAIIADRTSNRVLVISCAGNVSFQNGTRDVHQNVARFYSEDGGKTWSKPDDIAESIYSQLDNSAFGPIRSMFIASGVIYQSHHVKVGNYYRLYCAMLARTPSSTHMNFVLYSDDFGGEWKILGDVNTPAVYSTADEAKVTELPDGSLLISSRYTGGRYYNIFNFTDAASATGSWAKAAFSGAVNDGVEAIDNATNGEVMVVPVVRQTDGKRMHLLLQSLPLGPGRKNVGIYYKELESALDYVSPEAVAADWDGVEQVSTLDGAYSTMAWQADDSIAFFFEEVTYGVDPYAHGGYNLVYRNYTIEQLTDNRYRYAE
ncbi:MAG: exo-alpha-sialidase [Alistipes sp.]|nr:exo-alpha-sialidase [Alistipes sp.]